jgi:serine phosphatase RsbU (regulator of sigma subunit)/catechol 2,3-dioxygenase-like lactoylglutathione lyase family enzyme
LAPMSSTPAFDWVDRSLRLDRGEPHLRIQFVTIFVSDLDRSIAFFVDQLGFTVMMDGRKMNGQKRAALAPPDGVTLLAVTQPDPESEDYQRVGTCGPVVFFTDDVNRKFQQWSGQGVRFRHGLNAAVQGGPTIVEFEDPDGNSFTLAAIDNFTRALEEKRHAMAEKMEAEVRAARELEIAKEVQSRLFPQTHPPLRTLDYCGMCVQARQIGGDYYDFLDLGQERLGLIVGDISGKGIAAALLMANLQASLRSQSAIAVDDLQRLLQSVNRLFYENTADNAYATFFFAEYDDRTTRLRYANCGHLPGLLLRSDGGMESLEPTGTVLGLFAEWHCGIEQRCLFPGDVLALYTDGVTEALNPAGEEFGEERLCEALRRNRGLPPQALLTKILKEIQEFSPTDQSDDITLIIARCHGKDGGN